MEKQKPQPQPKAQPKSEYDILSIYDLDTVLKHAAEGKAQIARGEYFTHEEVEILLQRKIKASLQAWKKFIIQKRHLPICLKFTII